MTQLMESPAANGNGHGETGLATLNWRGAQLVVNRDESQFANMLDTAKFTQVFKLAELFAGSQLVPAHFQGKPADCFIGIQMALRLGVDPFMFLQNTYIVYGRPGMEAKLAIALINSSGTFTDPLDYEIEGENPSDASYRVRAFAVRKGTNKKVLGPWVDWKIVRAEKWDSKEGSKWRSIPGLMFQYRAATWFGRLHCPERLMGMQTVDELGDVDARPVDATVVQPRGTAALVTKLRAQLPDTQLPEPEIAARVAAEPELSPPQPADPADAAPSVEQGGGEESQVPPQTVPPHGRTSEDWINELVPMHKPEGMTAHQARKKFHAADVTPWAKLPAERQDEKYRALIGATFDWK